MSVLIGCWAPPHCGRSIRLGPGYDGLGHVPPFVGHLSLRFVPGLSIQKSALALLIPHSPEISDRCDLLCFLLHVRRLLWSASFF